MVGFLQPIGAHADVKELEYISALHQTQADYLRADGSIDAQDISLFLLSRHGIKLEPEYIEKRVLDGAKQLDLVQVLVMLLVPHLLEHVNDDITETNLFRIVHEVIMNDANRDNDSQPRITKEALREIMELYGELDISDQIIDEMMQCLGSSSDEAIFSVDAFKRALVDDVEPFYSVKWKDKTSTHYDDVRLSLPGHQLLEEKQEEEGLIPSSVVFLESKLLMENLKNGTVKTFQNVSFSLRKSTRGTSSDENEDEDPESSIPMTLPDRTFTAPSIDQVADTYRSMAFVILLWVTFCVFYLSYLWQIDKGFGKFCKNTLANGDTTFPCLIANGIGRWLMIFIQLSFVGTTFIFFASMGNESYTSNHCHIVGYTLFGMVVIFIFTGVTFISSFDAYIINTTKKQNFKYFYFVSLFMGIALNSFQFIRLLRLLYPDPNLKWIDSILTPSMTKAEVFIKQAAVVKTNRIIENALAMHQAENRERSPDPGRSTVSKHRTGVFGHAMLNFVRNEGLNEPAGGLWWAWKRYRSRAILYEDGVWIHSRLVAANVAQWFICFGILFGGAFTIHTVGESLVEKVLQNPDYQTIHPWQYTTAIAIGLAAGFPAAVWVTLVYIPSFISTVMSFRTGARPSLKDKEFLRHRYAEDNTTVLFGCALWGALFTGVITSAVVGGIFFFFFWEQTRNAALAILAQVIGITVTYTVKILILLCLRSSFFHAFYRVKPAASNIMGVLLECWNLGLSPGFILGRTGQILGLGILYIGRMDTDFLAKGVASFGRVHLDTYSLTFRKDLLLHEAHRHPYIERLGVMYMLKLRYGKPFMTRAGRYWRILFTLALMPWMRKYRLQPPPCTDEIDKEIEKVQMEIKEQEVSSDNLSSSVRANIQQKLTRLQSLQQLKVEKINQAEQYETREEYLEAQNDLLRSRNAQLMMKLALLQRKHSKHISKTIDAGVVSTSIPSLANAPEGEQLS